MRPMGRYLAVLLLALPALYAGPLPAQTSATEQHVFRQHMSEGSRLMRSGDPEGAISHFRRAIRVDARAAEAYDHIGWCYLQTAQLRYAAQSFSAALALSPELSSSRKGLGYAHYRLGRYQDCVRALRPAMPYLHGDADVQAIYGRALLELDMPESALPHLRAADTPDRTDPSLLLATARAYHNVRNSRSAELYYRRVLQLQPKHGSALKGLLALYQAQQKYTEARNLLLGMLRDSPNDPVLLADLAKTDQALGLEIEALQVYERLTRLAEGPQALELHITLAQTYMNSSQPMLARPHFQAAIARRPADPALRAALGHCLRLLALREEALQQYAEASLIDPQNAGYHFRRGEILVELGWVGEALAAYQSGLALDPENGSGLEAVAALAREVGQPELARDALVTLAASRPTSLEIRLALSDVYRDLKDIRSADVQAWEVLRVDPKNADARARLAASAEELGDIDGAIVHLRAIEMLDPGATHHLAPLGRLLSAQGRLGEAIREYELLLVRDPSSLLVRTHLAGLYVQTRQTAKARPMLNAILHESPENTWATDRLARCEELDGNIDRALQLRRRLARAAPNDRDYLQALVALYGRTGRAHEATDFLTTLFTVPNPPPAAVRAFATAYQRHSGADEALKQMRGLADIFVNRPIFMRVAAEACATEGLREEAISRYAYYLYRQPEDYDAVISLIAVAREVDDLPRALDSLTRYVRTNPSHADALTTLARVTLEVGKTTDAFAAVSRALEVDPASPECHRLLALVVAELYGAGKAVEVLQAKADATGEPAAYVGLGFAHVLNGRPDDAIAVLLATVETDRTAPDAAYVRGLAKNALGLHKDAVAEFARAAAGTPKSPDFRVALASALAIAGQPEDALWEYARLLDDTASEGQGIGGIRTLLAAKAVRPEAAAEALRRAGVDRGPSRALLGLLTDPLVRRAPAEAIAALRDIAEVWRDGETAWAALADAYQATGQPRREAWALAQVVDMHPANTSYHLRLARAHERANARSRAADAYALALAFDPDNEEASTALARLLEQEKRGGEPQPSKPRLTPPPSSSPFIAAGAP